MAEKIRGSGLKQVPLAEFKDDLIRFLREAAKRDIVITRHGKPAGVLIGRRLVRLPARKRRTVSAPDRASAGEPSCRARHPTRGFGFERAFKDLAAGPKICHHRQKGPASERASDSGRRVEDRKIRPNGTIDHRDAARSRSALMITVTELRLIAALAIIGFSRIPVNG